MKANPAPLSSPIRLAVSALLAACPFAAATAAPAASPAAVLAEPPPLAPAALRYDLCCFTTTITTADLNGDGDADVIAGNGMSYDVTVLVSDGSGGFADEVNYPVGMFSLGYVAVAAGDVTGDGNVDVIATGYDDDEILVYPGDGSGALGATQSLSSGGQYANWVEAVDINGDAVLDIVTANGDSGDVSVLLGDGAGGFASATTWPTGPYPVSMAVADVNGDGAPDVVTANAGTSDLSILLGDGAGGFAAPVSMGIGPDAEPFGVAMADVNGDGSPDIVVANRGLDGSPFPPPEFPGNVSVLINDGSGGFAAAVQLPLGPGDGRADAVALGDVTGDGNIDIVISRPIANTADVLAGDGAGGFADAVSVPTGVGPNPITIADVTGDGHLDVLTGNAVGSSLSVLPGDGAGNVGFEGNFPVGVFPHAVAAVDLNGDDAPDVVTVNAQGNDASVLINDGAGGFAASVSYPVDISPTGMASGDVNNDGNADIVSANLGGGTVSILLGDGAGGFAAAANFSVADGFESPYAVALGDANGDGNLDVATANTNISNHSISFLPGDGAGGFGPAVSYPVGVDGYSQPQGVVLTDVTGDGNADIVTANTGGDNLSLLAGDGTGAFAAAVLLPTGLGPVAVAAGDVDGDGNPDLVSLNTTTQDVSVLISDGAGGFAPSMQYLIYPFESVVDFNPWPWGLALGDVDGDGSLDIVTANTQNDSISVLPNDGAGGFGEFFNYGTGAHPGSAAIADIDGDGSADVITANRQNNNVSVLFNGPGGGDTIFANGFDG